MSKVTTDPIGDMLTRIRNAIAVSKSEIVLPYSNIKEAVAQMLAANGYIESVKADGDGIDKQLVLKIIADGSNSQITSIKRLSTPGRRQYVSVKEIPTVKNGRGIVILSTSKGIISGDDARKANIGGELICEVY